MRSLFAAVAALTLCVFAQIAAAEAAPADNRSVSKWEFRQVKQGMPMKRVHAIFGYRGEQLWFFDEWSPRFCHGVHETYSCAKQVRTYRGHPNATVTIDFARTPGQGWVVTFKSAGW